MFDTKIKTTLNNNERHSNLIGIVFVNISTSFSLSLQLKKYDKIKILAKVLKGYSNKLTTKCTFD